MMQSRVKQQTLTFQRAELINVHFLKKMFLLGNEKHINDVSL